MPFDQDPLTTLSPPTVQNGTTRNWAATSLLHYKFSPKPWDWKLNFEPSGFEDAMLIQMRQNRLSMRGTFHLYLLGQKATLYSCIHTKYMHINLESLSESIRRVLNDVKAPQLATVDDVASNLANISITEPEDRGARVERKAPDLIGVTRADKAIVFSHNPNKERPGIQTRQKEQNNEWLEGSSVLKRKELHPFASSNNHYLELSQFFNINTGAELREEIIKGNKTVLKGLVAVEFKKAGHIVPHEVQQIATRAASLAGGVDRLEGTMSILQQAVRYGYHYGVDCIYVTDYLNVIVAKLPRQAESGLDTSEEQTLFVDWAVVER
ncbi:hypothetical protein HETIRDRAFT_429515 [Heterobasidion irregulare TC 32-1]|uniref:Uncharacterized protein n=1 Tax=Heterobasidion irregulare (strain TC 32-1) TaxID=747525 RepID=W4JVV2_HETIT|nr:uncharacterized protein HETIRDRAFT_429515 [Heterobasidion irregulare TC 32-1]ETW77205.1 hypothetical protein HETIRDRAFT_429515 [Heterobasidion irregulare TC 32-1]